jgi:hypothetical protein
LHRRIPADRAVSADVTIILEFTVAALVGGALTLRRRTP